MDPAAGRWDYGTLIEERLNPIQELLKKPLKTPWANARKLANFLGHHEPWGTLAKKPWKHSAGFREKLARFFSGSATQAIIQKTIKSPRGCDAKKPKRSEPARNS